MNNMNNMNKCFALLKAQRCTFEMLIIKVNDERKNKTMKRKKKKMKLLKVFLFRFSCFEKIELKEMKEEEKIHQSFLPLKV